VVNEEGVFGLLLDDARDALSVLPSAREGAKDQQVKCALQEGNSFLLVLSGRHST
jgi:hypothetical protein